MTKKRNPSRLALMIGTLALVFGSFVANATAAGPETVNLTVTAVGKKNTSPPIVTKDDVQFYLNKERTQIADWKHGEKLYLSVLFHDSLATAIAIQWCDLKAFLAAHPATTSISLPYTPHA